MLVSKLTLHYYLISLIIFMFSLTALAADKSWYNLEVGNAYMISKELVMSDHQNTFSIKPNTKLVLKEKTSLSMIKVELYKFDAGVDCPADDMTSDIQLLEITQPNGKVTTVGFDLAEDCTLEAFVEYVDVNSHSIFK